MANPAIYLLSKVCDGGILTTNFPDVKRNNDIVTGQWRPINLMLPPFNLPHPADVINENCLEIEFKDKNLSLWSVKELNL